MKVLINVASKWKYFRVMTVKEEDMFNFIKALSKHYDADIIVEFLHEEVYEDVYGNPNRSLGFIDVRLTVYDDYIE